jgi:hypothetical protein
MSLQGSKASARLRFHRDPAAKGEQTYPSPGDYLTISYDVTRGLFLKLDRNGTEMRFDVAKAVGLDRLTILNGTLASRMMVSNLANLISLMSGLDLVCLSDELTRWTYVFREQPQS